MRAFGVPVEKIDFQKAAKSGLQTYLNTLGTGDRAAYRAHLTLTSIPTQLAQLEKKGVRLPVQLIQQVRTGILREVERQRAFQTYASSAGTTAAKLPAVDRLKVTLQVAQQYGLTPAEAQTITAAVKQLDDRQLAQIESRVWDTFGNQTYVRAYQRALKAVTPPKVTASVKP